MSGPRTSTTIPGASPGNGNTRIRQRRRLIDACISALHIYGPSRTTVEKVVALADLSPGIVRFYFDSKAAMLVASLEYLAAEFEDRVMAPVAQLKDTPVAALRLLVDLYLDADIASPRKVSVWYSFWGEASSRQEYYDICGKKDDDFAALVRELIQRLIAASGAKHLDADGVALGLIGVLEILWQGFAFQSEANINRAEAVGRSLAFLRSVFPGAFAAEPAAPPRPVSTAAGARLPASAYADAKLLRAEREQLLRTAWQVLGHEAELRMAGDFLTGDLAGERVLVVRAERDRLHGFRNTCRRSPHALVAERRGHLQSAIRCATHALTYTFDGQLVEGNTPGDLIPLEITTRGPLVLARGAAPQVESRASASLWEACGEPVAGGFAERDVAADWKVLVEQWLENPQPTQHYLFPNQLVDVRPAGAVILQVTPGFPGYARLRRFDFSNAAAGKRGSRAARDVWRRETDAWVGEQVQLAESTQSGLLEAGNEPGDAGPVAPALAEFRDAITRLLEMLPARQSERGR